MESVWEVSFGVTWDPNDVNPARMVAANGLCELRLGPHPDDSDRRDIVLCFQGVRHASLGSPNDEARPTHRLWQRGLRDVEWAGVVYNSELTDAVIHALAHRTDLTHWIILLKEETAEVLAQRCEAKRE